MADRKVSVALELHAGQFKTEAKTTARDVEGLSDKVEELDRDITKIPSDAAKAAIAFKLLGAEAEGAADQMKRLGQKDLGLSVLDAKIRNTRAEMRKLADEFGETGDLDVFKKLGDAQGRLGSLTKIRKQLAETIEDGAKDAANSPELRQIGTSIGGALAVPLLAALGGALAGTTGLGIAGVGLAGAVLGDPQRFEGAWGIVARGLKSDFLEATSPFTRDVYDGLARIGPLVKSWHLDAIFKDAEKYADPLFDGIEGLSTGLVRGVGVLVNKGEPAVHALSDGMIILGQASEEAFTSIADGAQGGAYALKDLSTGVGGVIRLFGEVTGAAEKAYGYVHDHPFLAAGATGGMSIPLSFYSQANDKTKELKTTQYGLEQQAIAAGKATDGLTAAQRSLSQETLKASDALGSQLNNLLALDRANDAAAGGVDKLKDAFRHNGSAIEGTSKAAQENRQVLQSVIDGYLTQRDAAVAAGDQTAVSVGQANAVLRKHLEELRAVLVAHGDDTSAVDRYIQKLDSLDGKVISVRVDLGYTSHLPQGISLGNLLHRASGGSVTAGQAYVVGERRPEVFVPSVSGTIVPSVSQYAGLRSSAGVASSSGAAQQQTLLVILQYPDGRVIANKVIEWNANRGRTDPATYFVP